MDTTYANGQWICTTCNTRVQENIDNEIIHARTGTVACDPMPELWQAAWFVAWAGATNPVAVARSLSEWCLHLGQERLRGTMYVPAVAAITGHLEYLLGRGLGPSGEDLNTVKERCIALGMLRDNGDGTATWLGRNRDPIPAG